MGVDWIFKELPLFDNNLIYKIQQSNDIVEVISEHLKLDRKGKEFVGLCPFHQDNKPSMYVNPVKGIFKCFACGAGGDVIKFIQMKEGLSFVQAMQSLAQRAGIQFTARPAKRGDSPQGDPKQMADVNLWAAKLFRSNLQDESLGKVAIDYLKAREINDESIKVWGLGFACEGWDGLLSKAKGNKFSDELLVSAGLTVSRETQSGSYDKFRNRLMFPIINPSGKVIGFGGRTLGDDPAKYMNSPTTVLFDKSNNVYGLNNARYEMSKTSTAIVVEGYTDVIMAHQFGVKNVVATLGTSFTAGHARLLRRFAKYIVLIFDSDVAGTQAADRALEVCLKQKVDIKVASVPAGKDPCDYLLTDGADAFRQVIADAVEVMEYKWFKLKDSLEKTDNITDRKRAIEQFTNAVTAGISGGNIDHISAGLLLGRLSKITGIDQGILKSQIQRKVTPIADNGGYTVPNQQVVSRGVGKGYFARAQEELLEVLLCKPGLFEVAKGTVTVEMFDEPILRTIAEVIFKVIEQGSENLLLEVLGSLESSELSHRVTDMEQNGQAKGQFETRLNDAIKAFDEYRQNSAISAESDEDKMLREIYEKRQKGNFRNTGMLSDN